MLRILYFLSIFLVPTLDIVFCLVKQPQSPKISIYLLESFKLSEKVNLIISFENDGNNVCLLRDSTLDNPDKNRTVLLEERPQRLLDLRESLINKARISQEGVIDIINVHMVDGSEQYNFTSFWMTNQMFVEKATFHLTQAIAEDFEVSSIREEMWTNLMSDSECPTNENIKPLENDEPQENLKKIEAPEAWDALLETPGDGVLIGFIDSGARHTHEALRYNFAGEYGWYDPLDKNLEPLDNLGHGTLVTGIAVGSKGIGVAPSAKWTACRACIKGQVGPICLESALLKCGEFFFCPTHPDGSDPDCSKTPHIINNSWGFTYGLPESRFYDVMIDCWLLAGIIPVFAAGNSHECGSISYPAEHPNVTAVGNLDNFDVADYNSSFGPTQDGRVKPDIAAPGFEILSAFSSTDTCYNYGTGASMAAAHVSGAIALLLDRKPEFTYEQVQTVLYDSADMWCNKHRCETCLYPDFANNIIGHGRVNALKLLQSLEVS